MHLLIGGHRPFISPTYLEKPGFFNRNLCNWNMLWRENCNQKYKFFMGFSLRLRTAFLNNNVLDLAFFCQWCIANVVHLKCLLPSISNSIVFQFSISLFFLTVGPYSCCSTVPFSTSSIIFGSWLDPGAKLLSGLEKK